MSTINISSPSISAFVSGLSRQLLKSASPTHLPTQLPLTLPTPLHSINLLTVLHLVHSLLSSSTHAAYFAGTPSDPRETAIRGIMGLFLASDEDWGVGNLLSATAWKKGLLGQQKVVEFFGVEIMREREHETMKGVRVGESWAPGVRLCEALVGLFGGLGGKLLGRCVGEQVAGAIRLARQGAGNGPSWAADFAKAFCAEVIQFEPSLADTHPQSTGTVLPAAPLRLLQDLANRQSQRNDLDLPLPPPISLSNISPLPLPIPLLLCLNIFDLSSNAAGLEELNRAVSESRPDGVDFMSLAVPASSSHTARSNSDIKVVEVPLEIHKALQTASVEACRQIWAEARFAPPSHGSSGSDSARDAEWKSRLSMLDVAMVCERLQGILERDGFGLMLVPV